MLKNINIDLSHMVKFSLNCEEKESFLFDLIDAATQVIERQETGEIENLHRLMKAWEYTTMIKYDQKFYKQIEDLREEILADPSPGIPWREVLGISQNNKEEGVTC